MMRQNWIDKEGDVAVRRQCILSGTSRASHYAQQKPKELGWR